MIFFKITKGDWRDYLRILTALTETLSFLSSTQNGRLTTACDSNSRAPGAVFLWAPEYTWMHMQTYTHPHINTNKSWKDFAREWRWELRIFFLIQNLERGSHWIGSENQRDFCDTVASALAYRTEVIRAPKEQSARHDLWGQCYRSHLVP